MQLMPVSLKQLKYLGAAKHSLVPAGMDVAVWYNVSTTVSLYANYTLYTIALTSIFILFMYVRMLR